MLRRYDIFVSNLLTKMRGFAKNEIIAAVGKLHVPARLDVFADGYRGVKFTGKNISLNVADNQRMQPASGFVWLLANNVPNIKGFSLNKQIRSGSADYAPLRAFYDRWFEDALGFSVFNEGNLLNAADWHAVAGALDITDTVEIQPWTPYVAVPENIVTDPPKTGGASALGFALMAAATAAAVTLKKLRA